MIKTNNEQVGEEWITKQEIMNDLKTDANTIHLFIH